MREIGCNQFKIILIEDYSCNNKSELVRQEQKRIDELKPYYNTNRSFRTEEQQKEQVKKWNNEHKEQVKKWQDEHKSDFKCEKCDFIGNKSQFNRHCKSKKHK